jgi:hypothetical protein
VTVSRPRATLLTLLALAVLSLAMAAPAIAGSLLSGYGGPGQGSQAILGSQLLNRPSGGGGSNGAGSSPTQGAGSAAGAGDKGQTGTSSATARGRASTKPSAGRRSKGTAGRSQSQRGLRAGAPAAASVAQSASVSSPALGLSGADLLYILVALGALASTAVLTRRFARPLG